jgi:hypothetical protein
MKLAIISLGIVAALVAAGCSSQPTRPEANDTPNRAALLPFLASDSAQSLSWDTMRSRFRSSPSLWLSSNQTPQGAIARLVGSYEKKLPNEYAGVFTGDFKYEFSASTDPTLVQMYSAGWFKSDETASASHMFSGYTPPGGATLPAASSIDIQLANGVPTDDNTAGVDPATHKVLATRVDGSITVPQDIEPITYVITNNYNVFYLVRGDVAVGLDPSQPADSQHWYVYHWVDLSVPQFNGLGPQSQSPTWGSLKGLYR